MYGGTVKNLRSIICRELKLAEAALDEITNRAVQIHDQADPALVEAYYDEIKGVRIRLEQLIAFGKG